MVVGVWGPYNEDDKGALPLSCPKYGNYSLDQSFLYSSTLFRNNVTTTYGPVALLYSTRTVQLKPPCGGCTRLHDLEGGFDACTYGTYKIWKKEDSILVLYRTYCYIR